MYDAPAVKGVTLAQLLQIRHEFPLSHRYDISTQTQDVEQMLE